MENFFQSVVVTDIFYAMKGHTEPGRHVYKDRRTYELGFRLRGDSVSTAQGKTFAVTKGDAVFKPKGVNDVCETRTGTDYCSVWFDLKGSPPADFYVFKPIDTKKVEELFYELAREERKHGINLKGFSIFYEILHELTRRKEYVSVGWRELLTEAEKIIDENYARSDFSVSALSAELGVSATCLREIFNKKHGKPPMRILIEKRLDLAKKLLLYSDYSMEKIAFESGFESGCYFSRAFKKRYGVSPSAYRGENAR